MANLLEQASNWLEDQRTRFAASLVTYQSGSTAIQVLATVGKTLFQTDDGAGAAILTESRDYLILASDLAIEPQPGDQVVESAGSATKTYEVARFGSEPCWRWSDNFFKTRRIHTKLLTTL